MLLRLISAGSTYSHAVYRTAQISTHPGTVAYTSLSSPDPRPYPDARRTNTRCRYTYC